jgi:hypothetical protein
VKKILKKLLEIAGSSKSLAYELIDAGMPYDEEDADKLANSIRQWKRMGKVPKKWEKYIKKVAENLGIQVLDKKDKKLLECVFISFLKDIKISYYENKEIDKAKALIFLIFMLILDKKFISKNIEKEFGNFIELEKNK